jgi:predicted metal-dependent phosphoesterase TrpH
MIKADLHLHTHYSNDGELPVDALLTMCRDYQLHAVSITDHNSTAGIGEALVLMAGTGLTVVPGIEIDCEYRGIDLHLLGYRVNWQSKDFQELDLSIHHKLLEAFPRMVDNLRQAGIGVDADEVLARAGKQPPSPELIAEVLLSNPAYYGNSLLKSYMPGGSRSDMPYINFVRDFFIQGKPAYVKIDYMSFRDAVSLIRKHNGIPVIAHPGANLQNREVVIQDLLDEGAEGLEAFSNYHDPGQITYFAEMAIHKKVLLTCGSDFHGKNKPLIKPGAFNRLSHFEDDVDQSVQIILNHYANPPYQIDPLDY